MEFDKGLYNPDKYSRIVTKEVAALLTKFNYPAYTLHGYRKNGPISKDGVKVSDLGGLKAARNGGFTSDAYVVRAPYYSDLEEWLRIAYNIEVEKRLTHVEKDDFDTPKYYYRAVIGHQYGRKPFASVTSSEKDRRVSLGKVFEEVLQFIIDNDFSIR